MFFRQDWLMRQVDLLVQSLARILLGKDAGELLSEPFNEFSLSGECDLFSAELNALTEKGEINRAENLLFERAAGGAPACIRAGLVFYSRLNQRSDLFLEEHGFPREEIQEGLRDLARAYGVDLNLQ